MEKKMGEKIKIGLEDLRERNAHDKAFLKECVISRRSRARIRRIKKNMSEKGNLDHITDELLKSWERAGDIYAITAREVRAELEKEQEVGEIMRAEVVKELEEAPTKCPTCGRDLEADYERERLALVCAWHGVVWEAKQ